MRVEQEEVPFYTINFLSKSSHHKDSWPETILAQPDLKKQFNDLGIMRALTHAREMTIDMKPIDLEILM